jgi:hypothetical protein
MRLFLLPIIFCLSACATQAQMEMIRIAKTASDVFEKDKACLAAIESKPEYARVYEKLGMGLTIELNRMPSPEQMSDNERVTDKDIALGLSWYAETQDCTLPAINALASVDPEYQDFFAKYQNESADLIEEIVKTKPTFGYINQRLMAMKIETKEAGTGIAQNLKARLIAQHQEEVADVTENAVDVLNLITALATKQSNLVRAQRKYSRFQHATFKKVRVIKCNPANKSYSCVWS